MAYFAKLLLFIVNFHPTTYNISRHIYSTDLKKYNDYIGGNNLQTPQTVTVETTVQAPIEKVWKFWTEPGHITKWNNASDDWHTPSAKNDLKLGGKFVTRMEAKDGSAGFDFGGTYDEVILHKLITYTMDGGRVVSITFKGQENETEVIETFDADTSHPIEFQQQGWQAILNNFKKHVEETND
jgi:uncharacterized protein YndB with AHSA1/START domain